MKQFKSGIFFWVVFCCSILSLSSCKDPYTEQIEEQREFDEQSIQAYLTANNIQNAVRQASGVYYVPQTAGTGDLIKRGNTVRMHYITKSLGGYKYQSTYDTGQAATIRVGTDQVTPGLTEGLQLLKNGEKASIIVPSHLAYGVYGDGYIIPPNDIILYDITVLDVD